MSSADLLRQAIEHPLADGAGDRAGSIALVDEMNAESRLYAAAAGMAVWGETLVACVDRVDTPKRIGQARDMARIFAEAYLAALKECGS